MTVQIVTETAMAYVTIFTFIFEIYLLFTNVTYVFFKLRYFVPPLLKGSYRARSYRRIVEFSRTGVILLLTMYAAIQVFWATSNKIKSKEICRKIFRLPAIYFYLLLSCRVLFAYARFVMFKYSLNWSSKWDTVGVFVMLLIMFVTIVWYQVTLDYEFDEVEEICFIKNNTLWVDFFVPLWVIYEAASFALYYTPLKETDGLFGTSLDGWANLLTTKGQQLDDMNYASSLIDEIPTLARARSTREISKNASEMIEKFHKSVKRHFWAGVAIMFTGTGQLLQFIIFDGSVSTSWFLGVPKSTRVWYFQSGLAALVWRSLGLILYVSMMLSERNSQRAFIPFLFWKRESWDA